jgi:hypothetical protein
VEELLVNAKKANTKRVYFWEQQIDITKICDYESIYADCEELIKLLVSITKKQKRGESHAD